MRALDALELAASWTTAPPLSAVRAEIEALGLELLELREIPTGPKITVMR
jgi:hypothetical protein